MAQNFFCRLLPPRPSFAADMTSAERELMQRHAAYWRELLAQGKAIAFGPVADPKGAWGLGLLAVRDEHELRELQANDPALALGMRYDNLPMPALVSK
jgi:alkylation response protein AidB-like acyl-CoA dehydrogenase